MFDQTARQKKIKFKDAFMFILMNVFVMLVPQQGIAKDKPQGMMITTSDSKTNIVKERITIPLAMIELMGNSALNILSKSQKAELAAEGIDVKNILKIIDDKNFSGTVALIDDIENNERVRISIER